MVSSNLQALGRDDLIVARATPPGAGAVAIVRIDGRGAGDLVGRIFEPTGRTLPVDHPRRAIHGRWVDPATGAVIDDGLTIFFRAPHSFTGNDLAEFQCHGSPAVVRCLVAVAVSMGARAAGPGEFTRRAYLNGRLDLAQAEAVADLIRAETDASARGARLQLWGGLSREIERLREILVTLAAEIEARIDFPEEDIAEADAARLSGAFDELRRGMRALLETRGRGAVLREGARVVLVGAPNAGKSSLLNALAREDRAIVTPHAGTTRDTVECTVAVAGVPVILVDTAGLRESEEAVERIGIERTLRAAGEAGFALEVRDASGRIPAAAYPAAAPRGRVIVENKADLAGGGYGVAGCDPDGSPRVRVSAVEGEGMDALERALAELILGAGASADGVTVGARHAELIERALGALDEAAAAWREGLGGELVMVDLRRALSALDEILGRAPSEAVLDRVFEKFCIGK